MANGGLLSDLTLGPRQRRNKIISILLVENKKVNLRCEGIELINGNGLRLVEGGVHNLVKLRPARLLNWAQGRTYCLVQVDLARSILR